MTTKNIDWNDEKFLREVVAKSTSKKDVLLNIGYNPKASVSLKKLNNAINKFNIPIIHFRNIKTYWKDIEFELKEIVKHEITFVGVLRKLNRQPRAGNYKTLQKYISIYNIDKFAHNNIYWSSKDVGILRDFINKKSLGKPFDYAFLKKALDENGHHGTMNKIIENLVKVSRGIPDNSPADQVYSIKGLL